MLLAGLGGLGAEVAKNLILAGVKGLTLLDHEQVQKRVHTHTHFGHSNRTLKVKLN